MANFTPQEIEEILQQFFDVTGKRQYIGARYIPIFGRKNESTIEWDGGLAPYEPLTIVLYQGDSYTSRTYVPAGIDISNQAYWALTGNYNAQIEAYRVEVLSFNERITTNTENIATNAGNITAIQGALPVTDFDSTSTVKKYIDDTATQLQSGIDTALEVIPASDFDSDKTVKKYIDATTLTGGVVKVGDFAVFATLNPTDGYINSIAYDSNNDIMYVANYISGDNSQIKKYNNWSAKLGQTNVAYDAILNVTNNHCNSMTLYHGKLYCSSWNGNLLTIVDASTFANPTNVNAGINLRAFAVSHQGAIIQPYSSNIAYLVIPFTNNIDELAPYDGAWLEMPMYSQSSYVQDSHIYDWCYYRLCSCGGAGASQSKNYIEIYPINSQAISPMIIPIDIYPNGEYEGITTSDTTMFLSVGNTIIYSTEAMSIYTRPQIRENNGYMWSTFGEIVYPNAYRTSLPRDTSQETSNTFVFKVPQKLVSSVNVVRPLKVTIHVGSVEGHNGGYAIPCDVKTLGQNQNAFLQSLFGGNLSDGFYVGILQVYFNTVNDVRYLCVKIVRYSEIKSGGITTKTDSISINDVHARID